MGFLRFVRDNARWLVGGYALFFFSSVGQTFFISLSAANIRGEYGLSHGAFGSLYMAATLASALTLPRLGQLVDRYSPRQVVVIVVSMLAVAAGLMAVARHIALLFLAVYLLRVFGQGMMSHSAFTFMARWFLAQRGRAVSLTTLGLNTGEALLPLVFVGLAAALGWRNVWWLAAAILLLFALPLVSSLLAVPREPRPSDPVALHSPTRDWTRAEALRDPFFYLVMLAMVPPSLIGNTIFFHQAYLVELRGWSLGTFASSFALYAGMTIIFTLVSGQLIDRFSCLKFLPFYLLPLGLGLLFLGSVTSPWVVFVFMGLYGVSNGFSLSLFGSLWPEIYGLKHLGAIRAIILSVLAFASAVGPGMAGLLIDAGVNYLGVVVALGAYCVLVCPLMLKVVPRLKARA